MSRLVASPGTDARFLRSAGGDASASSFLDTTGVGAPPVGRSTPGAHSASRGTAATRPRAGRIACRRNGRTSRARTPARCAGRAHGAGRDAGVRGGGDGRDLRRCAASRRRAGANSGIDRGRESLCPIPHRPTPEADVRPRTAAAAGGNGAPRGAGPGAARWPTRGRTGRDRRESEREGGGNPPGCAFREGQASAAKSERCY